MIPTPNDQEHVQGPVDATIVLIHYGDFECPFSGAAYPSIKQVQAQLGERLVYVFRSFPLYDIHPHALRAAEAAEAAGAQDQFWPMYDLLFPNQHRLDDAHLVQYARQVGLDMDLFVDEMNARKYVPLLERSIETGRAGGAHGTPTFFINGQFFDNRIGLWDADALMDAIDAAGSAGPQAG